MYAEERESKSRCSKAIEERSLRSQSASSSHFSISAVRLRLFLHLAQRTPVATTLCSCMIAGESAGLKHVKRNPPHRVLLTTNITVSHFTLSHQCRRSQHPLPRQSTSRIPMVFAPRAILDLAIFATRFHVPLSSESFPVAA
jgi:hypothetical protein